MKIKLAILEKDKNYLSRVVSAFNARYVDKLEIYSFTELDIALKSLETDKIDVFIAGDEFDVDFDKIPKQCGFAYFVDSPDVGSFNNRKVICKFQKADLIYKAVLDLYAENTGNTTDINDGKEYAKIVAFSSMCGGVGTSSLAAAYAIRLSGQGKRTLYLNLEKYGSYR